MLAIYSLTSTHVLHNSLGFGNSCLQVSHSQKSATFRVDKSARNVKKKWAQKRKKISKVRKNAGLQYKIFTYLSRIDMFCHRLKEGCNLRCHFNL